MLPALLWQALFPLSASTTSNDRSLGPSELPSQLECSNSVVGDPQGLRPEWRHRQCGTARILF